MLCTHSKKEFPIVSLGMWLLHVGRIKTAAEFSPIAKKLRRVKYEDLAAAIAKIKEGC